MTKNKNVFMRATPELLKELAKAKLKKKESYAEVVERMLKKEVRC